MLYFSSRVFLLGPSHHYYTPRCALTGATSYRTPIGDLPVDQEGTTPFKDTCQLFPDKQHNKKIFPNKPFIHLVIEELKATGKFEMMDMRVDEAEHSMEMHLPYLAKVFKG
jgi:MEMO1 family protein